MDINNVQKFFFQRANYKKERDFDSYSQSANDIIYHYIEKYPEVDNLHKREKPLSIQEFDMIKNIINEDNIDYYCKVYDITKSFEFYTLAFISGFERNNSNAIKFFFEAINRLTECSIEANINKIFIQLQIAQLYQRESQYRDSLKILFSVYKEINCNKTLMDSVNNFFASCCVSIGLLYYHQFDNTAIAGAMFYRSIQVRFKYKEHYESAIFENYISSAYRYASLTYFQKNTDQYYFLYEAYKIRLRLLNGFNDNYTKEEFVFLSNDCLFFLIRNSYNINLINLISNRLYKNILTLNFISQHKICDDIIKVASMLSKYYCFNDNALRFRKWDSLTKYFKMKFNDE